MDEAQTLVSKFLRLGGTLTINDKTGELSSDLIPGAGGASATGTASAASTGALFNAGEV